MSKYWFLKLTLIGLITMVLSAAMLLITRLVDEREARQTEAAAEIRDAWSGVQQVAGPVLTVPIRSASSQGPARDEMLYLLPETLSIDTRVTPHLRHRGLFETVVYSAKLTLCGHFQTPELSRLGRRPDDLRWPDAEISFGLSELRGLRENPRLDFAEQEVELSPATGPRSLFPPTIAGRDLDVGSLIDGGTAAFELTLSINGSGSLVLLPLGRETRMTQASGWRDPSFQGAFLPISHEIADDGFAAEWTIPQFARNYPQAWITGGPPGDELKHIVAAAAFGTDFLPPVDFYQRVSRCTKYAILFVTLTFAILFLFELLTGLRIHPLQYMMVGFAICLFYLLLLAVAEHLGFAAAYLAAAAATVALISGYSAAVLRTVRRATLLAGALGALYGVLYVLVQMQTYSLLVGSVGLFLTLATAMYLTRTIDWYGLGDRVLPRRTSDAGGAPSIQPS